MAEITRHVYAIDLPSQHVYFSIDEVAANGNGMTERERVQVAKAAFRKEFERRLLTIRKVEVAN